MVVRGHITKTKHYTCARAAAAKQTCDRQTQTRTVSLGRRVLSLSRRLFLKFAGFLSFQLRLRLRFHALK
eukprot:scaffold148_cov144-Isochrysis_galbana.AAC.15